MISKNWKLTSLRIVTRSPGKTSETMKLFINGKISSLINLKLQPLLLGQKKKRNVAGDLLKFSKT